MKSIHETLGENIRKIRKSLGWSQASLAEKADVSVSYITMIELGQRSASLEIIQIIAEVFDVPASELFTEDSVKALYSKNTEYLSQQFQKNISNNIQNAVAQTFSEFNKQ